MPTWDDLDQRYGFKPVPAGESADPWAEIDKRHLTIKGPLETKTPEPVTDFRGNLQVATPFGTLDTRIPLPQFVNKGLAQVGSGVADWLLSANQMRGKASPEDAQAKRAIDSPLNAGIAGSVLNFGGKMLPALAIPNVGGPIAAGALAGGLTGAFEPVGPGESRGANTALGVGLGAALPAGIAGVRKMMQPADSATAALAQKAITDYGIPLGPADISGNKFVRATRSFLNDVPFVGSVGAGQNEAKTQAFNKAVGSTFGADAGKLTPEVVGKAKEGITSELNRVWNNNTLKVDPGLITDIVSIQNKAASKLNSDQARVIDRHIQELLSKVNGVEIDGAFANNWQSELRQAVEGEKGLAKSVMNDLRQSVLKAFNRGVSPDDAAALTKARSQYGNFKTVEPLITKAELGIAGRPAGDIAPALLSQAVNTGQGSRAIGTPLGDLSAIGSRFLADRTSQTGGSPRAMIQNAAIAAGLTGGGGAVGAAAGGLLGGAGGAAGALGAGMGTNWALGSPTLAKMILSQGEKRGLLSDPDFLKALQEAARTGAYRLPLAGLGLLSPSLASAE